MKSFGAGSSPFFFWASMLDGFQAVLIGRSTRTTPRKRSERYLQPSTLRVKRKSADWNGTSIPILHADPLPAFPEESIAKICHFMF
jgi:hypothetical protein